MFNETILEKKKPKSHRRTLKTFITSFSPRLLAFTGCFMHIYKHESHATISATDIAIKYSFTSSGDARRGMVEE
jgi:hypothetical protein